MSPNSAVGRAKANFGESKDLLVLLDIKRLLCQSDQEKSKAVSPSQRSAGHFGWLSQ